MTQWCEEREVALYALDLATECVTLLECVPKMKATDSQLDLLSVDSRNGVIALNLRVKDTQVVHILRCTTFTTATGDVVPEVVPVSSLVVRRERGYMVVPYLSADGLSLHIDSVYRETISTVSIEGTMDSAITIGCTNSYPVLAAVHPSRVIVTDRFHVSEFRAIDPLGRRECDYSCHCHRHVLHAFRIADWEERLGNVVKMAVLPGFGAVLMLRTFGKSAGAARIHVLVEDGVDVVDDVSNAATPLSMPIFDPEHDNQNLDISGLNIKDIEIVAAQACVPRRRAVEALKEYEGDIVAAILALLDD
jgi:hypothetical protein